MKSTKKFYMYKKVNLDKFLFTLNRKEWVSKKGKLNLKDVNYNGFCSKRHKYNR